jgi:galactokinase
VINQLIAKGWQPEGLEFTYFGDIPNGAGLSSSATIEMVTAFALNQISNMGLSEKELVLLSQKAENEFVGVQCGIMDQYAVGFGKEHNALMIDCNEISHRYIEISFDEYKFVVVNSNKKRGLLDSAYNQRVKELEKVKEIINESFEVPYLGSLTPEDADWIEKLIPDETLLKRVRHIVNENARVKIVTEYLKNNKPLKFGEMMVQSHDSLKHDFEVSCAELDILVDTALKIDGVAGARMTGAGFGGCTINLIKNDISDIFSEKIIDEYKQKTGIVPDIYPVEISGEMKRL